ncbi:MAG: Gfo/Idh/MocA family oxidoreductase [Opitutaceae bacterium]|jgi:predicted dehydrogenase|nr:Gfo/Idh/MocA family oxidoreductase [Opitutaceae bacterium]
MKTIRLGLVGTGLMGREIASAVARWCHLEDTGVRPVITALCGRTLPPARVAWFREHFPSIHLVTADHRELAASADVDAVYCAVPHHLHAGMYTDVLRAGKHLLGEKPFGIDQAANTAILAAIRERPDLLVRCSSEFPFFPAVQRIFALAESGAFGRVIEVNTGFLHSSDLDPAKPINWKRTRAANGDYGVMGDLGMHVCHVPFRLGWKPRNVRAVLSNIVTERPDGKGGRAPCDTWDNATLLCEAEDREGGRFPWTLRTQRIAPGQKNTWYVEIAGTKASARFSTKNPKRLELLTYAGGEQAWQEIDVGYAGAFKAVSGEIFEFGFTDAMQQMTAAYLHELAHGRPLRPSAGCVTPEETALSHRLFTAALRSQELGTMEQV